MDPAFNVAGSQPGFELWRIEALKPVKIAEVSQDFGLLRIFFALAILRIPAPMGDDADLSVAFYYAEHSRHSPLPSKTCR